MPLLLFNTIMVTTIPPSSGTMCGSRMAPYEVRQDEVSVYGLPLLTYIGSAIDVTSKRRILHCAMA
jgi:hypothetical protein